jgi:hypothetical protein
MLLQPKHLTRRPMVMALSDADVIGDPFGGPASGSREKSKGLGMVIGVVAAVATAGAGMALWSTGTLAGQLAGGAMIAGGVMSGVGAVTGNQKLSKIGGYLSLAGGIGGFAAGAMGGLGANAAGEAASMTDVLREKSMSFGEMFDKATGGAGKAVDTAAQATITTGSEAAGGVTDAWSIGETVSPSVAGSGSATGAVADAAKQTLSVNGTAGGTGSGTGMLNFNAAEVAKQKAAVDAATQAAAWDKGILPGLGEFGKQNSGLLQIGGQALSGMMGGIASNDQTQEAARQYDEAVARNDTEKMRMLENINGGVVFADPQSPNYQQVVAAAGASGRKVQNIGINPNAGTVSLSNGFTAASTPAQQQTQRPA